MSKSSVLMKGIEMPLRCFECPCCHTIGYFECVLMHKDLRREHGINISRPDWCPLVEVKEPHGDLVDRQAALDALDKRFDSIPMEQTTEILLLRKDLRELPSAQPKRGKWIKKHRHYGGFRSYTGFDVMGEQHTVTVDERTEYDDLYCSECGARSADNFLNFCPNCGTDMRGEQDE